MKAQLRFLCRVICTIAFIYIFLAGGKRIAIAAVILAVFSICAPCIDDIEEEDEDGTD